MADPIIFAFIAIGIAVIILLAVLIKQYPAFAELLKDIFGTPISWIIIGTTGIIILLSIIFSFPLLQTILFLAIAIAVVSFLVFLGKIEAYKNPKFWIGFAIVAGIIGIIVLTILFKEIVGTGLFIILGVVLFAALIVVLAKTGVLKKMVISPFFWITAIPLAAIIILPLALGFPMIETTIIITSAVALSAVIVYLAKKRLLGKSFPFVLFAIMAVAAIYFIPKIFGFPMLETGLIILGALALAALIIYLWAKVPQSRSLVGWIIAAIVMIAIPVLYFKLPAIPIVIAVAGAFIIYWFISLFKRRATVRYIVKKSWMKWIVFIIILAAATGVFWYTRMMTAGIALIGGFIVLGLGTFFIILLSFPGGREFLGKFMPGFIKFILLGIGFIAGFWIISNIRPPPIVTFLFLVIYPILFPIVMGKKCGIPLLILSILAIVLLISISDVRTENVVADVKSGFKDIGHWFELQYEKIKRGYERAEAGLTGEYFEGEVQEAAEKKLGVYLEEFRSVATTYTEGEPIILYAKIRAETLTDKPITVKVDCSMDNKPADETIPYSTFTVDKFAIENIDCKFFAEDKTKYPAGNYRAKFTAGFDFTTNAFIKAYFMNQEKIRDFKLQNIEPTEHFGFEKRPKAVYSAGPIMIGMDLGEMPLGIRETTSYGPTIGVTIENMWNGKIKKLKNITIMTPGEIKQNNINGKVEPTNCEGCERGSKECVCNYDLSNLGGIKDQNIIMLRVYTTIIDPETLIGAAPVSFKSFRISTDYDYAIEEEMGIKIRTEAPASKKILGGLV